MLGIQKLPGRDKRDGIHNVTYMQEACVALAQLLYAPGALALGRKKSAAADVSAWQRPIGMAPPRPRRTWTPLEDHILLAAATIEEAAAHSAGPTSPAISAAGAC